MIILYNQIKPILIWHDRRINLKEGKIQNGSIPNNPKEKMSSKKSAPTQKRNENPKTKSKKNSQKSCPRKFCAKIMKKISKSRTLSLEREMSLLQTSDHYAILCLFHSICGVELYSHIDQFCHSYPI